MRQLALSLPHQEAMSADDFLVTTSNRDAVAWTERWPVWPAPGLIVSGAAGSGKTHLLSLWLAKSGGRILSVPELPAYNIHELADRHIAIDDAAAIAGDPRSEEALFHLFNHLQSAEGSLVLALPSGVLQAGFQLPDLRSRLLTLPVASLGAPDEALLAALIIKQFRDRQITPDAGVVDYIATRARRDGGSLRRLIARLDEAALAQGRKIGIALARQILEETHAGK